MPTKKPKGAKVWDVGPDGKPFRRVIDAQLVEEYYKDRETIAQGCKIMTKTQRDKLREERSKLNNRSFGMIGLGWLRRNLKWFTGAECKILLGHVALQMNGHGRVASAEDIKTILGLKGATSIYKARKTFVRLGCMLFDSEIGSESEHYFVPELFIRGNRKDAFTVHAIRQKHIKERNRIAALPEVGKRIKTTMQSPVEQITEQCEAQMIDRYGDVSEDELENMISSFSDNTPSTDNATIEANSGKTPEIRRPQVVEEFFNCAGSVAVNLDERQESQPLDLPESVEGENEGRATRVQSRRSGGQA